MAKKRPFRISVDINDVLRDYKGSFSDCFKKMYFEKTGTEFKIEDNEITNFDFTKVFPFESKKEYEDFRFYDYAYEIFGRATVCDNNLPYAFNDWTSKVLRNFEEEDLPEVRIVSPFEMNLTIQATLAYLSRTICRIREIYFPVDSLTIWDGADLLITANPNLIKNVPEGKKVIKIEQPYNKEVECEHSFKSMIDLIHSDLVTSMVKEYNDKRDKEEE